jgi:hypothetical protein
MGFVNRLPPPLYADPGARVYRVHMPHDVQVKAACEDVGCDSWRFGWETVCDESDEMQAMLAMGIRAGETGRTFREMSSVRDGRKVAVFRFDAGQRCFAEHRTRPGRLLVHQGGRPAREHASLADLAEDYMEHTGQLAEQQERG